MRNKILGLIIPTAVLNPYVSSGTGHSLHALGRHSHILSAFCIARKHVKSGCLNNFWSQVFTGKQKTYEKLNNKKFMRS